MCMIASALLNMHATWLLANHINTQSTSRLNLEHTGSGSYYSYNLWVQSMFQVSPFYLTYIDISYPVGMVDMNLDQSYIIN
jgi:hypothetical protein